MISADSISIFGIHICEISLPCITRPAIQTAIGFSATVGKDTEWMYPIERVPYEIRTSFPNPHIH
jgi:hypothetical protein